MSILDRVKHALGQHTGKARRGMDEIGDKIDEKTGGRHSDTMDPARQRLEDMTDNRDDQPGGRAV
jgi:hypothetical protein